MIPDAFFSIVDFLITCLEMFFVLYLLQNEERKKGQRWIVLFVIFVISVVCMTKMEVALILKLTIQVILIVFIGKYVYKCSIFKLTVYGVCYIVSLYASELIVIQSWNLFLKDPLTTDNIIYKEFLLSAIIAIKALHFLIVVIIAKIMEKDKSDRQFKEIIPIVLMSLPFILILESISLNLPYVTNERYILIFTCCSIATLIAFIANIIFNNHYLSMRRKSQEEEVMVYQLQLKYDYYQRRMEDEERIKEIYHDLKNHFLLAGNTVDGTIKDKLQHYENYYDMGNEFLNIIISEKSQLARENKIILECDGDFKEYGFLDPLDISTIFGNALDNSIEACLKVEENNRFIFLNVVKRGNFMLLVIKNTMENTNSGNDKFLKTGKKNKAFHGYGLTNIKKTIKKYNGDCSISAENGEFIVSIVIPIPDKEGVFR